MEYTVVIRLAPDGMYIGSCPLIPEAQAQGERFDSCLENMEEVVKLSVEYRQERGEEIRSATRQD